MNHATARPLAALALLAAVATGPASAWAQTSQPTTAPSSVTVYVVRHAEKQTIEGEDDPPLTAEGEARALALVGAVPVDQVVAVYSSPFVRTRETVAPLAEAAGVPIEEVDAHDIAGLVDRIRAHDGGAVVVAGHSDTVPELLAALGVSEPVTIAPQQYGDLFIVQLGPAGAALTRAHFGP